MTDILDALYSIYSRRMMPLFAIDPSGIGQISKHNPEQLDDVALHERVRKLESDHHTRDVICLMSIALIKIGILLNIPQIQQMMPALLNMYLQNKQ